MECVISIAIGMIAEASTEIWNKNEGREMRSGMNGAGAKLKDETPVKKKRLK